jgi:hypothetical protein
MYLDLHLCLFDLENIYRIIWISNWVLTKNIESLKASLQLSYFGLMSGRGFGLVLHFTTNE